MGKPLTEHRATIKAGKGRKERSTDKRRKDEGSFEFVEESHLQPVNGGRVRRIEFGGRPATVHEEVVHQDRTFRPRHEASMRDIEWEIDHIGKARRPAPLREDRVDANTREVYRTDRGGEVRSAYAPVRRGTGRVLYTTVDKGTHQEERRFSSADVDRVIAGVRLKPDVEVIRETKTEYVPRTRRVEEKVPVAPTKASSDAYYDYKGDVHPVLEVEGIGPKYAKKLEAAGIHTTSRLCYEDAAHVAATIGAHEKTVRSWQSMSELAKVKGIGPQYAEALARAGIEGIQELKDRSANAIADQVNEYLGGLKNHVLGSSVTAKRVEGWQKAAKPMRRVRQAIPEA